MVSTSILARSSPTLLGVYCTPNVKVWPVVSVIGLAARLFWGALSEMAGLGEMLTPVSGIEIGAPPIVSLVDFQDVVERARR